MSTWTVSDSRTPRTADGRHANVKDALREAMASGQDVYLHADDCPPDRVLGPDCPCRPLKFARTPPARRFSWTPPTRPTRRPW